MPNVLVAVDGSESALNAVRFAIKITGAPAGTGEIHLLNVQPPLPEAAAGFVADDVVRSYHQDEGRKALKAAIALIEKAGGTCRSDVAVGDAAQSIVDGAKRWNCEQIVMGTRGHGAFAGLLLGSVTTRVLHLADRPVTVVK